MQPNFYYNRWFFGSIVLGECGDLNFIYRNDWWSECGYCEVFWLSDNGNFEYCLLLHPRTGDAATGFARQPTMPTCCTL